MGKVPQKKSNNFLSSLFKKNHITPTNVFHPEDNILMDYYQSLANYHPDLIIVFTLDGEIVSQNKGTINEFLGYHPEDNLNYADFIPEKSHAKVRKAFFATLKGVSQRLEIAITTKSKQTLYALLTFIPIKQTHGDVEGIYIIVRDITEQRHLQQQLRLKENHLTHAQQIANIGSWEYIIDEDRIYCSDYFYNIFGIDKQNAPLPMERPFAFVHPDDCLRAWQIVEEACQKGMSYGVDYRIYHGKTNELRYIRTQAEIVWQDNKPYKLIGVVHDYTAQKQLEAQMAEREKSLRHIFDNLNVGIWLQEFTTGKVTYISKGLEEISKYPQETLLSKEVWKKLVHPDDWKEAAERQKLLETGETLLHKYRIVCGDGTVKWVFDQTVPWFNDYGNLTHLFGMLADITPEVEMRDQLDYFATHDTLTGLPNQRSLYTELDHLCAKQPKHNFALFYFDLDRFKLINDSLGYQIGDEVLKLTAKKLLATLPDNGYLARISSNDFVAVVENYLSKDDAFMLAEDMIRKVEEPLVVEGYNLHITTSIGISFFPDDGETKLSLIENAHAALYHAKNLGKNNYQFYSFSRDITSYKKYVIEKDMRKAIVNEEFEIYYQPRVSTSGVILGAEALLRWRHEDWGLISPGEFIPLAEENHLINRIGDWVIRKVCAQLHSWKMAGITLRPVSINVSPIRFLRKGLVELVEGQLSLYNLPAKYLEFEITESSILKNEETVINTLTGLKELGTRIAIDDFGTGYASLSYLRDFQADTIKIDQVFTKNINDENNKERAIISSILHLAKGIGMKTVAEGVEEYEQLEFLRQKECDEIQGYLFSKPIPVDEFEQMLKTGYIKPNKPKLTIQPAEERRNYYRLELPTHVLGEITITEVNKQKVNLGSAHVLIEDIGLGGIKVLSSLDLPINNTSIKFHFYMKLIGEKFDFDGALMWKNDAKNDTFCYGINFDIDAADEDRLAVVINKMSVMQNLNQQIPDTDFIDENPYTYLKKNFL